MLHCCCHNSTFRPSFVVRAAASSRDTKTPHSGYHFDGSDRRFFEGWYFKVSIPEVSQSFAWMYSIEDPGLKQNVGNNPLFFGESRFPCIGAQIMGADGEYLLQSDEKADGFWASKHELELGYTFSGKKPNANPKGMLNSQKFLSLVDEGFQVSPVFHQGYLRDICRSHDLSTTVESARWEYTTRPVYGWGPITGPQLSTAGWLAAFQVFEPHWQVCMAGGLSTGFIEWGERRFEFEDAPSYVEKNWGGSFPEKWFWVQCNVFEGVSGQMALTAGGGRRKLPLFSMDSAPVEEVAMIGIHYKGEFYSFVPWNGEVSWEIKPWGRWKMAAKSSQFEVELVATTSDPGTVLRAPTKDFGLAPLCKDSFKGELELKLWEVSRGRRGALVVETRSSMAALEVGGGPWWSEWVNSSSMPAPLKDLIGLNVDLEGVLPEPLRPPGL